MSGPAVRDPGGPAGAGADALRLTAPYRVRFDEAGPDGLLRTSALLRYAQDVGWQHSEARGLTREWYAERGLAWVVRAAEIRIVEPVPMGATLHVTTQVVGYQRIWAQRRAEVRLAGGALAAQVRTDWVMIDGRGRLVRVPPEISQRFPAPLLTDAIGRVPLGATPAEAARTTFAIRPHELDPMNHPNNAVYVDWIEEALLDRVEAMSRAPGRPRELALEYAAAPAPDARVTVAAWAAGGGWAVRITDADSRDVLRATVAA